MSEPLQLPSPRTEFPGEAVPESEPIDPYGRKSGYQSWQATIRRVGNLKIEELKKIYGDAINHLEKYGNITLRELAVMKAYEELITKPNPGLLGLIMEREEGRVPQTVVSASGNITDWMEYARENNLDVDEIMAEAKNLMDRYNEAPKVVEGEIVE